MTIRVYLVDDQMLVRTGFRMLIDAQPDMTVVGEAADGAAAVAELGAERPAAPNDRRGVDGRADAGDERGAGHRADHR